MSNFVEGVVVHLAVVQGRDKTKPGRKVIQILSEGTSGLLELLSIADMCEVPVVFNRGEKVVLPVTINDYQGHIQRTYWGPNGQSSGALDDLFGFRPFDPDNSQKAKKNEKPQGL